MPEQFRSYNPGKLVLGVLVVSARKQRFLRELTMTTVKRKM